MGVSHDHNTLGPPDHPGISPIAKGKPLPKRDRAWECAGGEEYYCIDTTSLAACHKSLPELLSAWWYIRISVSLVVCQNFHQPGSMSP